MRVDFHPEATAELEDSAEWYGQHSPSAARNFVVAVDLAIAKICEDPDWFTRIADGLWIISNIMENVADFQSDQFRKSDESRGVCRNGLWKVCRPPNYFFEFLIWTAYILFAIPSITHWMDVVALVLVPLVAYWFLVHFTGIPITEQASLDRRGEPYADYQATTNRFFPCFPRTSSNPTSQASGSPK